MSIIYEALQKTQRRLSHKSNAYQNKRLNWFDISLIVIICILLMITFATYYPKAKHIVFKSTQQSNQPKSKPLIPVQLNTNTNINVPLPKVPAVKLTLSGIFVSDQEKIALINNRLMKVGDVIEGKKVMSIDFNSVKLQEGNTIYTLESTS